LRWGGLACTAAVGCAPQASTGTTSSALAPTSVSSTADLETIPTRKK
jgi:hypothetical protein